MLYLLEKLLIPWYALIGTTNTFCIAKNREMACQALSMGRNHVRPSKQIIRIKPPNVSVNNVNVAVAEEAESSDFAVVNLPKTRSQVAELVRIGRIEMDNKPFSRKHLVVPEIQMNVSDILGFILRLTAISIEKPTDFRIPLTGFDEQVDPSCPPTAI